MRVVRDLGVNVVSGRIRIADQKRFGLAVLQFENHFIGGGCEAVGRQIGYIVVDRAVRRKIGGRGDHARHRGLVGGEGLRSRNRPDVGIVFGKNVSSPPSS